MSDDRESRGRARIEPLAPLAFAISAGVLADRYVGPLGTFAWSVSAVVLAGLAALAWRSRGVGGWAIVAAFVALGGAWHHYWWSDLAPDDLARAPWTSGERRATWVRGVPFEASTFREGVDGPRDRGSTRTVLALTGINDGRGWRPVSGKVQTFIAGDRSDLEAGRAVEAAGVISPIEGPLNPGEVDFRPILRSRGIRLRLSVDEPSGVWSDPEAAEWPWTRYLGETRAWAARTLASGLDPAVDPLASALLLGRRAAVDPELNDAFARTGTTHLLAISGLQLQVIAVALGACLRGMGVSRKWAFGVVIVGTVAYAMLVGLAPSVVRSAAMTVGACLAGMKDRWVGRANLLSGAALATLLLNPTDLFDVGCQLSFLAVGAILWSVPSVLAWGAPRLTPLDVLERRLEPWGRRAWRTALAWLRAGIIGSTVISAIAWPLVALRFHVVSPIGILLNIPLIPLTSLALLLSGLTLLLSIVWPPLGAPFAWACGQCLGWTEAAVRWGTAWRWGHTFVPGPSWGWTLAFYALLGLATMAGVSRWRSRRLWWSFALACGAMMAALPLFSTRPATLEAEVLAVGHGLSVVIRSPEGRTVLYDCGKMGDPHVGRRLIAPALWSREVRKIDVVILSHADSDHYNGLPDLLDRFSIGVVRVPPGFEGPSNPAAKLLLDQVRARGIPVEPIASGDQIDLGGETTLTALHPGKEVRPGSTDNARSVVLEVASGGRRFLLTGDLERDGLTTLIARASEPVDAMLAPHHGGRTSNPPWLFTWAKPTLVVVSQRPLAAGSRDPLEPLAQGHFPLLRTWQSGAIRLRWSPTALLATGFLDPPALETTKAASLLPTPSKALAALLGLAIGAAAALALTVVEWGAWSLVLPGRRLISRKDSPDRRIHARAPDGTRLAGSWFPCESSGGRTLLLLHGLAEDRSALLGRVPAMLAQGWNVAVLDARTAGESEGRRASFGARESADLLAWLDALLPLAGPTPTFAAWGRSMGASTALRTAAADPRIAALILEAPYKALHPAVAAVLRRLRIPFSKMFARLILRRANVLAGIPLDTPRPIDLAPVVKCPVLILHGLEDAIAPVADARNLAEAFARPAEILEVPGAGHSNVVGIGGDALMERVGDFLDRSVPDPPDPNFNRKPTTPRA
jgi:competence protein ComEC